MKKKTYLVAAGLAAAATFAKEYAFPKAEVAYSTYISPDIFEPACYGLFFFIGLRLMTATHRLSVFKKWIQSLHDWAITGFTGIAGGVAGWGAAAAISHVLHYGIRQIIPSALVAAMGIFVTLVPLGLDAQTEDIHASYSSFRLTPRRGTRFLWLIGLIFCIVAIIGMVRWLHGKH
jgi:hypothetical protein